MRRCLLPVDWFCASSTDGDVREMFCLRCTNRAGDVIIWPWLVRGLVGRYVASAESSASGAWSMHVLVDGPDFGGTGQIQPVAHAPLGLLGIGQPTPSSAIFYGR